MKKITLFVLTAITAVIFAACAAPVENKPVVNTNVNAKPAAAPPTVAALLDLEKKAGEAWSKNDSKFYEGFIVDNAVGFYNGKRTTKAEDIKMMAESKCDIKNMSITEEKMIPVGADAAVLVTKATAEGTCGGQKVPSPSRAATLYVRSGDTWKAAYHNEVAIMEPKAAPAGADKKDAAKPAPADADDKKDSSKADASQLSVAGDEKKDNVKKSDDVKKEDAGKEHNAKTDAAKTVDAPGSDELTTALLALETSGWNAWKAHDTASLGGMMTNDVTFIDPIGGAHFGKADNMSTWTAQKCEVKSVALSDPKGFSILPTVAILTFKGTAEGTCDGEKLTPVWGTGIYVKEGDAWKLAFHLEDMAKKG